MERWTGTPEGTWNVLRMFRETHAISAKPNPTKIGCEKKRLETNHWTEMPEGTWNVLRTFREVDVVSAFSNPTTQGVRQKDRSQEWFHSVKSFCFVVFRPQSLLDILESRVMKRMSINHCVEVDADNYRKATWNVLQNPSQCEGFGRGHYNLHKSINTIRHCYIHFLSFDSYLEDPTPSSSLAFLSYLHYHRTNKKKEFFICTRIVFVAIISVFIPEWP